MSPDAQIADIVTDEELADLVRMCAAKVARRVPGLEAEDVAQDVWCSLTERWDSVVDELATLTSAEDERRWFTTACFRLAKVSERRHRRQLDVAGVATYDSARVRVLLTEYLSDPTGWTGEVREEIGLLAATTDAAVSGDHLASVMDVSAAWLHLDDKSREILTARHGDGDEYATIAALVGATDVAVRKAASRALQELADVMTHGCQRRDCELCGRRAVAQRHRVAPSCRLPARAAA